MVGVVRPNDPGEQTLGAPSSEMVLLAVTGGVVQSLQRTLWGCAKRSPERRFHALYDRAFRGDVVREAGKRVRKPRGAAGGDAVTLAEIEAYGVKRMLGELQRALRAGRYRPALVRRVAIAKPDCGMRPLGVPTVADRVVQQAVRVVLEPIFEADFLEVSHGFGPRRSATDAAERIRGAFRAARCGSQKPTSVTSSGRSTGRRCWRSSPSARRVVGGWGFWGCGFWGGGGGGGG